MKSTTTKFYVWPLTTIFPGPVMWSLYVKVFPRKCIKYLKLSTFWIFMPENCCCFLFCFLCPYSIYYWLRTLWDSASANILKPLVSLHKRPLRVILLKNTTLVISGYNFLSILPLKETLNYNKGVLIHQIMSGKVPPSLRTKFSLNQSRHSGKLSIPVPRTDLFQSSLVNSGKVLWNSLPDSLRLPPSTETFKSCYMSYTMRWLVAFASYIWWL